MPRGPHRPGKPRSDRTADLFSDDLLPDPLLFERRAHEAGYVRIAGIDEAGRGPLAGPVVAAAVVLPEGLLIEGLTDSKKVPAPVRERLFDVIRDRAVSFGIGSADVCTIDKVNIREATIIAMERALEELTPSPDFLLIDALTLPRSPLPQNSLIRGDCRSHSIAAASILAKVTRDRIMHDLHEQFPQYNFRRHKGYGTQEHLALLAEHGPCEAHRKTFSPVAELLAGGWR